MVPRPVILATVVLLLLALLPLPYGYYPLLRLVVCPVMVWVAVVAFGRDRGSIGASAVALALVFNPILPVYLDRVLWSMIDVGAALYLAVGAMSRVSTPVALEERS